VHSEENLTFEGYEGVINILGGDWQNAVYKVSFEVPEKDVV
jgi:hypothetical protein